MSTSTFQHRPPAMRNLGERIFARGSGRASRFVTDRLPERDHNGMGSLTGTRSQSRRRHSSRGGSQLPTTMRRRGRPSRSAASRRRSSISVLQVDGQDTGRLRVVRRGGLVEIAELRLVPEHQSRGLGRTVVGTVVAEARASVVPVELGAEKDNPRARVFWERCGSSYVGEDETEHRRRLAT